MNARRSRRRFPLLRLSLLVICGLGLPAEPCDAWAQQTGTQQGGQQQSAEQQADNNAKDSLNELPPFETIHGVVQRSFAATPSWKPGELVTKGQVDPVLADVFTLGWKSLDRKALLTRVLADDSFLSKELRTRKGAEFMHKIAALPGSYDKLDRLSRLPSGRKTVHALINGAGGDELIEYLTTSTGGEELGKLLENGPKGKDFNKSTGLIYTMEDLVLQLKAEYEAELAKRAKTQQK